MAIKMQSVGTLQKGSYIVLEGAACRVVDMQVSRPGKHGHAKVRLTAVGMVDGKKRVVDLEKKLLPFTYRSARCKSKFVLEFEPGTIQKTRTKLGDLIYFANNA